ncbi:hypothetical protein ACHAWF_007104 [Thalassiosira exigua]
MPKYCESFLYLAVVIALSGSVSATEEQCQIDCGESPRPVGPTRPWDAQDPLRNPLRLTRPYPYHIAANDEYDFAQFCKLGCNYFFVDPEKPDKSTLGRCLGRCDEYYDYNSLTPPYNDLAEVARLECRDGCLMALRRCQPGYYCLQVSFEGAEDSGESGETPRYSGGEMIPCPAGTYRDVSYDAVEACIPCPPNYFREDIKGRSIASCSPCSAGTSAVQPGSDSVRDCVRCKAGTFSNEASFCMCITPMSCAEDQLPSPADAEKRETVPFIGRW